MCGITTIFSYGENAPVIDKKELTAIHNNLTPRGPDGEGVWIAENQNQIFWLVIVSVKLVD